MKTSTSISRSGSEWFGSSVDCVTISSISVPRHSTSNVVTKLTARHLEIDLLRQVTCRNPPIAVPLESGFQVIRIGLVRSQAILLVSPRGSFVMSETHFNVAALTPAVFPALDTGI
jgi:hypothetical protein